MLGKVFFNLKPPKGSYGGGSFFVQNMTQYLLDKNYYVTYELEPDLDYIIIIDPRKGINKKYGIEDILEYLNNLKKDTNKVETSNDNSSKKIKLIYRVNECDIKRFRSINIEPLIIKTIKSVDKVIFISKWLQDYFIKKYKLKLKNYSCILNGCNNNFFFPNELDLNLSLGNNLNKPKIKLVTHHWSDNYLKGFHIYNLIDKYLGEKNKRYNL